MNSDFLNSVQIAHQTIPWNHIIIDDFLPSVEFAEVQKQLCAIKTGYLKLEDDIFALNYMFLPHLNLAKLFLSDEFANFLGTITNTQVSINEKNLVQLRLMNSESPGLPPHTDDSDTNSLAVLYYLSPNSTEDRGGDLILHPDEFNTALDKSTVVRPKANRLVIFSANEKNWHSVSKVENWNRFTITSQWTIES
ncbi:MAG: 2OG-Fe(II) oxygenase [Bdellovibrio sp.]|nr:2OG-Fe(II) oxygenase [Bdellovibrio sp.]